MMCRAVICVLLVLSAVIGSEARNNKKEAAERAAVEAMREAAEATPTLVRDPYRSYSWRIDEEGDTVAVINLRELTVFPPEKFKNRKEEEFF